MKTKPTATQIAERALYLFAVILTPNTPLFFLYKQNAAQDILFSHCLILGGSLSLLSLVTYLLLSKLALKRRRTLIVITLFWSLFWFFNPLLINRLITGLTAQRMAVLLLCFIIITGFALRYMKMNRFVANTIAMILCVLFIFNFLPAASFAMTSAHRRAQSEMNTELPYEIKTEFNVDPDLPKPNIYWLHMDGMMSFEMIERYFGAPQTELKSELADMGFVINENARLNAGYTRAAVPALTCPTFYDSYLASEFERVADLTRTKREAALSSAMKEKGFTMRDVSSQTELLSAFSDTGYITGHNIPDIESLYILTGFDVDVRLKSAEETDNSEESRKLLSVLSKVEELKTLVTAVSMLKLFESEITAIIEEIKPDTKAIPEFQEVVDKYVDKNSDFVKSMTTKVREISYMTSLDSPHIIYYNNATTHIWSFNETIGHVTYDEPVGTAFFIDENGNWYTEKQPDPNDIKLYYPQHKYAVKQLLAMLEIIIENDPDAVIVIEGDHGIHNFYVTNKIGKYDEEAMQERGYNLEDMLNLNLGVISAVRIPEKYGSLTEPLDPLDIARYLVNNFVGADNYEYLYYKEES